MVVSTVIADGTNLPPFKRHPGQRLEQQLIKYDVAGCCQLTDSLINLRSINISKDIKPYKSGAEDAFLLVDHK
jgi:hypothetical protein